MKVLFNADDFGLTQGISEAIIELLKKDAISNTTIMICVEGAVERCQMLKDAGLAHRAGVHLQSTLENYHKKALSRMDQIPSLIDQEGCFKSKEEMDIFNAQEIEIEWRNQIERVMDVLGSKPSHMDSHHGVHRVPHLTPVYLKLAKEYDLPVRGGRRLNELDKSQFAVRSTTLSESTWTGQNASLEELKTKILEGLKKVGTEGVLELPVHPGFCDEELMKSSSWNTVREHDFKILTMLAEENWLSQQGIQLVQYPNL